MTYDEIYADLTQEKIDIFKAYDLLYDRMIELAANNENSARIESLKCSELRKAIKEIVFDDFTGHNYTSDYIGCIRDSIFKLEKAKFENKTIDEFKGMTEAVIKNRIEFLTKLLNTLNV